MLLRPRYCTKFRYGNTAAPYHILMKFYPKGIYSIRSKTISFVKVFKLRCTLAPSIMILNRSSVADLLLAAPIDTERYEALYKHFHRHPELSNLEAKTAKTIAVQLSRLEAFKITTNIGGHGVVGVLRNGPGKTILLRADMDALPILEATGLHYSSTVTMPDVEGFVRPVMHACGHDMHMTCLLAAAEILLKLRKSWSGTLIVLFQPAEERGSGAKAMVDDGLYAKHKIPVPDFLLGQHVMAMRAGSVGSKMGTIMAGADSMKITLFGVGGHGSQVG